VFGAILQPQSVSLLPLTSRLGRMWAKPRGLQTRDIKIGVEAESCRQSARRRSSRIPHLDRQGRRRSRR